MGTEGHDDTIIDPKDVSLASYVEKKIGDFVRAMNVGSGKNLYPTLMRAVERPLIELALRGNAWQSNKSRPPFGIESQYVAEKNY